MTMSYEAAKRRLGTLWFVCGGVLFVWVVLQSVFDKYGDKIEVGWQWFLPTILPTLSLIIAVFVVDAAGPTAKERTIDEFFYRLAFWLSVAYLFVVAITLVGATVVPTAPNFELLGRSQYWLAPIQGLATGAMGIFFIKKNDV
jgi:hypothetical protein